MICKVSTVQPDGPAIETRGSRYVTLAIILHSMHVP